MLISSFTLSAQCIRMMRNLRPFWPAPTGEYSVPLGLPYAKHYIACAQWSAMQGFAAHIFRIEAVDCFVCVLFSAIQRAACLPRMLFVMLHIQQDAGHCLLFWLSDCCSSSNISLLLLLPLLLPSVSSAPAAHGRHALQVFPGPC